MHTSSVEDSQGLKCSQRRYCILKPCQSATSSLQTSMYSNIYIYRQQSVIYRHLLSPERGLITGGVTEQVYEILQGLYMAEANNEQTTNSDVYKEAKILLKDLISFKRGHNVPSENATARTLRKLSDNIERTNPDIFKEMCSKLNFSQETIFISFREVANKMFSDGIINWGRIATLFAFVAQVAKYCSENDMSEQIDNIIEWTARFVTEMYWIEQQGGWNDLNRCFRDLGDHENECSWWSQW